MILTPYQTGRESDKFGVRVELEKRLYVKLRPMEQHDIVRVVKRFGCILILCVLSSIGLGSFPLSGEPVWLWHRLWHDRRLHMAVLLCGEGGQETQDESQGHLRQFAQPGQHTRRPSWNPQVMATRTYYTYIFKQTGRAVNMLNGWGEQDAFISDKHEPSDWNVHFTSGTREERALFWNNIFIITVKPLI